MPIFVAIVVQDGTAYPRSLFIIRPSNFPNMTLKFHVLTTCEYGKKDQGACDVTILDHERLECVHNLLLHRDCLHCASVYILSVAVLGSYMQYIFFSTKSHYSLLRSSL